MNQKTSRSQQKKFASLQVLLATGLFIFFSGADLCRANDWEPLPWGLNLEQLNQAYQKKYPTGQIREDKERSEIDLQYAPTRTIKIGRGELMALTSSKEATSAFRLFGYAYEGKFFGQAIFFSDHPELFPETINSTLKKYYPQGKVVKTFEPTRLFSTFEFKTDNLYLFTSEKGVFYYEPIMLEKVVKKFQGQLDQKKEKYEREWRDKPVVP